MVEEQKPADIEQLRKEMADIKRDMMKKELEDIKRDKMREELEELKAEQARNVPPQYVHYVPKLSIVNTIMAVLTLLVAGYMFGTLYGFNMASEIDKYLVSFSLPISGSVVLTVIAVVLAFIGFGLVTMAKK